MIALLIQLSQNAVSKMANSYRSSKGDFLIPAYKIKARFVHENINIRDYK